jgi:hypothetical protein
MKFIKNKSGFSIIEVVVSSIILSLSVFWIYKLIAENNKLINNSNNFLDANILLTNSITCLENIWFDNLKSSSFNTTTWSLYFENSLTGKCLTWNYDTDYTFTWVILNNLNYYLYWIISGSWSDYLDWNLWVYNESVWKIEKERKMWK